MANYRENIEHDNLRTPDGWLFLRALRAALSRPKLWVASWLFLLLLSLVPAMQTGSFFEGAAANRYPATGGEEAFHPTLSPPTLGLSAAFRQDHRDGLAQLDAAVASSSAVLALIAFLFGIFAAGGWLQVTFEQPERRSFHRFGFGGARYFARFLRVSALVLIALALVHWVFYSDPWDRLVLGWMMNVPEYDWSSLETLESERTAVRLGWVRDGLAAIAFAKVLAWAIYTRTRIVLRDGRSAVSAAVASWWTMLRHPIQTLRPLIFLVLVEAFVLLVVLGWVKGILDGRFAAGPTAWHIFALFAVVQLGVLWRQITRGAVYHVAGRVSQSLIVPTEAHPDPWAETIGGPGGPQYPVDDDGYHVTV